jgi:GT2 family glycosyltransferase
VDVSIVIVSWNARELIDRCLEPAFSSGPALSREITVIDNASSDGAAEWIRTRWPQVNLNRNVSNLGYAPACNQGLREARGRYVLALNTDAFLEGDALGCLVAYLDAHPDVAACAPRLRNADGTTQWVCARRGPRFLPMLVMHTQLASYVGAIGRWASGLYPPGYYEHTQEAEVLSGACLLFRREALERFGILDDRLILNYDDVEWSMRARREGARLAYVSEAECIHLGGASRVFDAESETMTSMISTFAFWDLTFGPFSAAGLKLSVMAGVGLSLLKNLVLAPFRPARRIRLRHLLALERRAMGQIVGSGTPKATPSA